MQHGKEAEREKRNENITNSHIHDASKKDRHRHRHRHRDRHTGVHVQLPSAFLCGHTKRDRVRDKNKSEAETQHSQI